MLLKALRQMGLAHHGSKQIQPLCIEIKTKPKMPFGNIKNLVSNYTLSKNGETNFVKCIIII